MAEAGFYHCPAQNDPDLVRCYVCYKELDGWEPTDSPKKEHARAKDCLFVILGKSEAQLTAKEFLRLEEARANNRVKKHAQWMADNLFSASKEVKVGLAKYRRRPCN